MQFGRRQCSLVGVGSITIQWVDEAVGWQDNVVGQVADVVGQFDNTVGQVDNSAWLNDTFIWTMQLVRFSISFECGKWKGLHQQ